MHFQQSFTHGGITIVGDDDLAKHILHNAGVLEFLSPHLPDAPANCILYWKTDQAGQHIGGACFYGRADGDNGYVAILADASVMTAAQFVHFMEAYQRHAQPISVRRYVNDDLDRYVASRNARQ